MATPAWVPGDPWVACDICARRVRYSESRKMWNGLRVCPQDWDPKHPLLNIRSKADRQAVIDARPEPPDRFVQVKYDYGSFCLVSPNGTFYILHVADDGALLVDEGSLGVPAEYFHLGGYRYGVTDDGAVVPLGQYAGGLTNWRMVSSPGGYVYTVNADTDGAILLTYVGLGPNPFPDQATSDDLIVSDEGGEWVDRSGILDLGGP